MELFAPGHLIPLLIVAAILFFGWKQLPDMARSAGRSLRVFRTEVKGLGDEEATSAANSALSAATETTTAATSAAATPTGAPAPLAPPAAAEAANVADPAKPTA